MKAHRAAGKRFGRTLAAAALGLSLAMLLAASPHAATFQGLYTISVAPDPNLPVGQRQPDAVRRALALVLTRVTGIRDVMSEPSLAEIVRNADRYRDSVTSGEEIRVGFLRTPLENALTELNMPIWGDERPSTLLWLAVDLGGGQRAELRGVPAAGIGTGPQAGAASNRLSGEAYEAFDAVMSTVLRAADERGLPIELPRLDAVDRRQARFADVWGGFDRFVLRAAERYAVDAVLIGRVSLDEPATPVRWTLRRNDEPRSHVALEPRAGIDWLADQLAAEYTIVGASGLIEVTITDIATWQDQGRVIEYLESLSIIDAVYLDSLSPTHELQLRVSVRGNAGQLRRVLTLGGVLQSPVEAGPLPDDPAAVPVFGADRPPARSNELIFRPAWLAADAPTGRL